MKLTLKHLVIGVVGAWIVIPAIIVSTRGVWGSEPGLSNAGQFGDVFGAINALFSGLAFAGLYWALQLQREQLELQRTELGLQREELKLQREEMKASRAELANQVQAQRDLFRASAAQIAVASTQASIEAIKMAAEAVGPAGRSDYIRKIEGHAAALAALADRIEGALPPLPLPLADQGLAALHKSR